VPDEVYVFAVVLGGERIVAILLFVVDCTKFIGSVDELSEVVVEVVVVEEAGIFEACAAIML
jgi:hypothetical protein